MSPTYWKTIFTRSFRVTIQWFIPSLTKKDLLGALCAYIIPPIAVYIFSHGGRDILYGCVGYVLAAIVLFLFYFLLVIPKEINEELVKEKSSLQKVVDTREKKNQLAQQLQSIIDRCPEQLMSDDSPLYREAVECLEKSGVISKATLYYFKQSRYLGPSPAGTIPPHPNKARYLMLGNMLHQIMTEAEW